MIFRTRDRRQWSLINHMVGTLVAVFCIALITVMAYIAIPSDNLALSIIQLAVVLLFSTGLTFGSITLAERFASKKKTSDRAS